MSCNCVFVSIAWLSDSSISSFLRSDTTRFSIHLALTIKSNDPSITCFSMYYLPFSIRLGYSRSICSFEFRYHTKYPSYNVISESKSTIASDTSIS
ncbi:uncharacterized protein BDW43DRAFT_266079, partial [Aspergillus alliaceus]